MFYLVIIAFLLFGVTLFLNNRRNNAKYANPEALDKLMMIVGGLGALCLIIVFIKAIYF